MYPGMVSESATVPRVPCIGIAPTVTVPRATLSDAVALVRGDSFYIIIYDPIKQIGITVRFSAIWPYNKAGEDVHKTAMAYI